MTSSGANTEWSADGNSLYVLQGAYPVVQLVKIPVDGSVGAATVLVNSKYATDISISPDEQWISFIEFNNLFVVPVGSNSLGANFWVSSRPGFQPNGFIKVSPIGAYYMHWAWRGDQWVLGWLLGSQYSYAPPSALAGCADISCVIDATTTVDLTFAAPSDVPTELVVCYDNGTIVTMRNQTEVINNGRIVVKGDRIQAVCSLTRAPNKLLTLIF